jgi:hypothetical protein
MDRQKIVVMDAIATSPRFNPRCSPVSRDPTPISASSAQTLELGRCPRTRRRHVAPTFTLTTVEQEILSWMDFGGTLHASAQLADVPECTVLEWIEHGTAYEQGIHGQFARAVKELEKVNGNGHKRLTNSFDVPSNMSARRQHGGNGALVRWHD